MRLVRKALVLCLISLPFMFAACADDGGGGDSEAFDTYQDCWNDHHMEENFSVQQAIVICCLDHPIGDQDANVVCGDTAGDCEAYVGQNLTGSDLMPSDITAACSDYITQRSM